MFIPKLIFHKKISLQQGTPVPAGPTPPNLHAVQIRLTPPVVYDEAPSGYAFGDVLAQPYPLADAGETIIAKFVSIAQFVVWEIFLVLIKYLFILNYWHVSFFRDSSVQSKVFRTFH